MRDKCIVLQKEVNCIKTLSRRDRGDVAFALLDYLTNDVDPDGLSDKASAVFEMIVSLSSERVKAADRKRAQRERTSLETSLGTNLETNLGTSHGTQEKEKAPPSAPVPPVSSLPPEPPITPLNPFIPSIPPKEKENSVSNSARTRKIPPSLEEVRAYCEQTGGLVDAEEWMAFYESKGWMVGKNKMTNWKSAVNTWNIARKKKLQAAAPKGYVYNYECGEDESL